MSDNINRCEICGETEFTVQEGYYYCGECGTQSRHVRDFEIEVAGNEESQVFFSSFKVKHKEAEKQQLTTWECFNYLLRGLVEELLSLGAKEELKLTVLQLWTTYLRKSEVAFFSQKQIELPKLGPKFSQRDAKILYNQEIKKKERKRKTSGSEKGSYKKQKKNFAKAEYDAHSLSLSEELSHSTSMPSTSVSQNTSSTGASNRPIRLNFSRNARRYYKRFMPASHLKKHELDGTGELECHTLHANKFRGARVRSEVLSRKTIYSLLYLALNLIEDDIQLCDLLRFTREGHISSSNFSNFFPDTMAKDCTDVLNQRNYFGWTLFHNHALRKEAANLCRFIHVPNLKLPNLMKIATRYVNDLSLPPQVAYYIERLYNLHPSVMRHKLENELTPCYEGRAMAYVVFTLKLLFILDGSSEKLISNSACTINSELLNLGRKDKLLFVWEDWVKYIEMRKVILTQCHYPTSVHMHENINTDQYLAYLQTAYQTTYDDVINSKRTLLLKMEKIFDNLHTQLRKKKRSENVLPLKCPSSLTPYRTYLQYILNDRTFMEKLFIPDFIRIDPSVLDIHSYVHSKELKKIFTDNGIQLDVKKIACGTNINTIGVFKSYSFHEKLRQSGSIRVRSIRHDIDESDWIQEIKSAPDLPDIFSKGNEFKTPSRSKDPLRSLLLKKIVELHPIDSVSVHSFDVFSEQNMEPLNEGIVSNIPRHFETESILTDISDDEKDEHDNWKETFEKILELKTSNFDCWSFLGINQNFNVEEIKKIEKQLPKIFQWLLKTCSEIAELEVMDLYQELLAIENQFAYALEPLDAFTHVLSYRSRNKSKDIEKAVNFYKNIW